MRARLIYWERFIYADGAIREMVLWQLPEETAEKPHGMKYRLYSNMENLVLRASGSASSP
jgi:hypothetical protein